VDKSKISKRKNPVSLIYYRQAGFLPQALLNFLGLMGGGMPDDREIFTLEEMIRRFEFPRISLGGPVFDLTKLKWLNGEYLRALPLDDFFAALRNTILNDDYLLSISALLQTRIETLGQFGDLADFFIRDEVLPTPEVFLPKNRTLEETVDFAGSMLQALEGCGWTTEAIDAALRQLGAEKEWSVKENFMLLRAILTGKTASPPLLESLVIFGKARSLDRLRRFIAARKSSRKGDPPAAKG
jgi:glutamyl-tRNA synthetase